MRRGNYARRACNHCRRRKSKCDGNEPQCGPCMTSGHECTWGPESAKRPNTKQYVDSLKSMVRQLDKRNKMLQERLQEVTKGTAKDHIVPDFTNYAELDTLVADGSSERGSPSSDDMLKTEEPEDAEIEQLCAPTHHLRLDDDDTLHLYGPTSIFRLAPRRSVGTSRYQEVADSNAESYQLLVAQNGASAQTEIDWARHLPVENPLSRAEHDRLLDLMFRFFTSWCLRVIPELFLMDMHRSLSIPRSEPTLKTAHYSPLLHNALLSVAAAFSDDPLVKDPVARRRYADRARDLMEGECERPKLSAILGLSILANYHSTSGNPTLGYMYFGISARLSQALGLGLDCTPWVQAGLISESGKLDRNWGFWTTYCQDTTWSLYVGRDFCVSSLSDVQRIPVPFVDTKLDEIPWHWPPGQNKRPNYLSRTFAATAELLQIARLIMDVVSNFSRLGARQEANDFLIAQMDLKLSTWKENLSAEVDISKSTYTMAMPHQLMLQMTHSWLAIILHRPFYRRRRANDDCNEEDHIKPCNRAASEIMELAETWRKQYTLRYVPITFIQVVSAAGTIFILSAVQATTGPRLAAAALSAAQAKAEQAIQYLEEIGESFASARGIADILRNLLHEQVATRLARRSPRSAQSPPRNEFPSPSSDDATSYAWPTSNATAPVPNNTTFILEGPMSLPNSNVGAYGAFSAPQQSLDYNFMYTDPPATTIPGPVTMPMNYHPPFGSGVEEYTEPDFGFPSLRMGMGMLPGDTMFQNDPLFGFPSQGTYPQYPVFNSNGVQTS
ncbi:hypothetical protein FA95DRAFT_1554474 [Auriscalpium vulgare]|uniref:Uncharacterized protein n=1 Tax=Auriscalpium vulgare TaxID=40419 RepID=A0ACB8S5G6_9AGAM|nr:hypothetical protein FA95DRAFT_1554474 [Auriscalpium vulgare]